MSATEAKGAALITGASAGPGAIYADRLAKRGYDLANPDRSHPEPASGALLRFQIYPTHSSKEE